jgi:ribonuclease Z
LIHSRLINPPFGDPGVYLEFMFERRRMLFDLGDLQPLSDRQLLRVSHIFVSHSHMDHFAGFDRMIRILLGRDRTLHLFGPQGFIERVWHRLASYTWNLVGNFKTDLVLAVGEYSGGGEVTRARLSCRGAFEVEPLDPLPTPNGILVDLPDYRVRAAVLDHGIPCLGFAVEQRRHVNIWKNKVEEMGFRVGPWLRELKQAILRDDPADTAFRVHWRDAGGGAQETVHPLGELRDRLTDIRLESCRHRRTGARQRPSLHRGGVSGRRCSACGGQEPPDGGPGRPAGTRGRRQTNVAVPFLTPLQRPGSRSLA